ncbi:hypothetical protein HNY42_15955 (plasmid) [Exiguobacterium sp. Helios]|uniref:hypothetical protein n=1 Tax=Exiguobacterium sp. Helios TaxID=2735868 RepID=UPI00165D74C2|nr:hypothetical protein [Exiguobacterium sp. Helios]QNR22493.1 hypothetical protein HNY42_15955 [Exiguobacterium sp. Helios]
MNFNNTIDLQKEIGKSISLADGTRKLTIKGKTRSYPVHQIPLEHLLYNRQNGRIISSMNRYESEGKDIQALSKEDYNDLVEQFIVESNKSALDDTRKDINRSGQRLPGVVLNDGTVVDGNRRYTCLRQLKREGKTSFFEAVILDPSEGLSAIDIKRLELNLQHGEERPVEYNAIDNLVEVYNDIEKNKYFTVKEYALNTNKTEGDVKKMLKKAILMVEFLEFINAEGKYYVARDMGLDGPLQEIMLIMNKEKDEEEHERVKIALFTAMTLSKVGDLTRHIRRIGKEIIQAGNREQFLEEYDEIVEKVHEKYQEEASVTLNTVKKVNEDLKDMRDEASSIVSKRIDETVLSNIKMKPIDLLNTVIQTLKKIDADQIARMDVESKKEFVRLVNQIREDLETHESRI